MIPKIFKEVIDLGDGREISIETVGADPRGEDAAATH